MVEIFAPIVLGALAALGGVALFIRTLKKIRLAKGAANHWPIATGKVLKSSFIRANSTRRRTKDPKLSNCMLAFEYRYVVDGKEYTSDRPLFFNLYAFDDIQKFLARYPEGMDVTVYYDPEAHENAVIETALHGKSGKHELAFSALLVLTGLVLLSTRFATIAEWFG